MESAKRKTGSRDVNYQSDSVSRDVDIEGNVDSRGIYYESDSGSRDTDYKSDTKLGDVDFGGKMEPRDVDYGWLVVFSGFLVGAITDGVIFSFGIMLVEIVEQFNQGRASTGVVISIVTGMMHMAGPLAGALSDYYGCRIIVIIGSVISCVGFILSVFATNVYHLWITYGFLGGIGFGLMYTPANVCVLHNFKEQRTLATGIAVCGSGVGMFIFNQLTRFLIQEYGWRGAILLEAGIVLQGAVVGLFLVRIIPRSKTEAEVPLFDKDIVIQVYQTDSNKDLELVNVKEIDSYGGEIQTNINRSIVSVNSLRPKRFFMKNLCSSMFDLTLLTDVRCMLFLMSTFILNLGFSIPFNLLPDQVVEDGLTKHSAAWLSSSIGISNTVSRILIGLLGDRSCVNRMILSELLLVMSGVSTALSPLLTSFNTKMIYTCSFGFCIGGYITLYGVLLVDLFGEEMISKSFGLVMFSVGVSGCIATPLGGLLFDYTGSYNISFIIAGGEFVLSGVILLLCKICEPKNKT
ncbi:hypothetical protein ACF0H5_023631 [Mactra antiquata]